MKAFCSALVCSLLFYILFGIGGCTIKVITNDKDAPTFIWIKYVAPIADEKYMSEPFNASFYGPIGFLGLITGFIYGLGFEIISTKSYTKEGREKVRLESKIIELKKEAKRKKIYDKASFVIEHLGNEHFFLTIA
jgi:hypothetical protein